MHIDILGKRYHVVAVDSLRSQEGELLDGECDAPSKPGKQIRLSRSLTDQELLETACHEYLHAAAWWLTEDFVTAAAHDLAAFLRRLGYRVEGDWLDRVEG